MPPRFQSGDDPGLPLMRGSPAGTHAAGGDSGTSRA